MNRTYNTLVDNGLFVLGYYLEKDIEEITKEDVYDSIDLMSDKINDFLNCEKYANIKSMRFQNSALTQSVSKANKELGKDRIDVFKDHLHEFADGEGTDTCSICGEKLANIELDTKGRCYFPNSNFINYTNNFKGINICPKCLLLSIYSVLNTRVNGTLYLYHSNEDDFMLDYTENRQKENITDILVKAEKENKTESAIDVLVDLIDESNIYEDYIDIYRFNNSGQGDRIEGNENIFKKQVQLIKKLKAKRLLSEFRVLGLSRMLLNDNIKRYLNYVYDFENAKLKEIYINKNEKRECSEELFNFLREEIAMVDNKTMELIKRYASNLSKKQNVRKVIGDLRSISSLAQFKDFLMENIIDDEDNKLLTSEEYTIMINRFKWKDIKNLLLIEIL